MPAIFYTWEAEIGRTEAQGFSRHKTPSPKTKKKENK
jgi:hypothetical protein